MSKETKIGGEEETETTGAGGMIKNKQMLLPAVLAVVAVVAAGFAFYFYSQYGELKVNPQKAAQAETAELVSRVAKLIVLPQDEQPTVATVTDPEQLKSQPFFANAQQGDKVLIYANARKAVLFNPEKNRIVEVAPLNIGQTAGVSTGSGQ